MNADAMGKVLGPVADNVAMLLSGVDGFLHDLRDFSTVGAGTWMGIAFVHEPEGRLLHSFGKHINNMLWHDSFAPEIRGTLVSGIRGFLVVQWIVQPLVETGSTGSHGSGQVPVLACGAGGEDIIVLVRTFGTWHRFIWGIILIAVAGDAGFLFDRYPLMFTCHAGGFHDGFFLILCWFLFNGISPMPTCVTGPPQHFSFHLLCFFPLHHLHLYQFVGIEGEAGKSGRESTLLAWRIATEVIPEFAEGAPPCILACRGFRGFRGFKVAKVPVTGCTGFRGVGEVAVCAGPTIWFVVHFRLMYFLMVSITHKVNRASAHRAIAPHARMSVIPTNIVMVSQLV